MDPAQFLDVLTSFIDSLNDLPNNLAEFETRLKVGYTEKGFLLDRSL